MLNTAKIRDRISELGLDYRKLSEITGISVSTLRMVINNRREANTVTVERLKNALRLEDGNLHAIFFAPPVAKRATKKSTEGPQTSFSRCGE